MQKWLLLLVLITIENLSLAQTDSIRLTNQFVFKDGLYLTYQSFQDNEPDYTWDATKNIRYLNTIEQTLSIDSLQINGKAVAIEKFWGVCVNGQPFIRISKDSIKARQDKFIGIAIRGRICYYAYGTQKEKGLYVNVHDPVSGQLIRRDYILQKEPTTIRKIFLFQKGIIKTFNSNNLKKWMKDDEKIMNTLADLKEKELSKRLFKILRIYNDRNRLFLKE